MFENISLPTNVLYIEIHRKNPMNPQGDCILTNGYVNCTDRFFQLQVTTVFPNSSLFTQPPSLYLIRYYLLPIVYIYVHTPSVT